jgi:hypothetical protein
MVLYDNRVSGRSRAGGEPVISAAGAPVRASQLIGVYKLPDPDSGAAAPAALRRVFRRLSGNGTGNGIGKGKQQEEFRDGNHR